MNKLKTKVMDIGKEFSIVYREMKDGSIDSGFEDYATLSKLKLTKDEIRNIMKGRSVDGDSPTDFTSYLDTLLGGGQEGKPLNNEDVMNIINMNPEVQEMLGLTGHQMFFICLHTKHIRH